MIGNFKMETPKVIWIDEIMGLRSEMYAFKCVMGSKNNLKGVCKSQSKSIKFEEFRNCLEGSAHREECENYKILSINHEMYLLPILKSTLPPLDEKRCCVNKIKSTPWILKLGHSIVCYIRLHLPSLIH